MDNKATPTIAPPAHYRCVYISRLTGQITPACPVKHRTAKAAYLHRLPGPHATYVQDSNGSLVTQPGAS